jgi:hypothetical protein
MCRNCFIICNKKVNLQMASPQKKISSLKSSIKLKKVLQKGLDMRKLSGKLSWKGNAVKAQKSLRANDR